MRLRRGGCAVPEAAAEEERAHEPRSFASADIRAQAEAPRKPGGRHSRRYAPTVAPHSDVRCQSTRARWRCGRTKSYNEPKPRCQSNWRVCTAEGLVTLLGPVYATTRGALFPANKRSSELTSTFDSIFIQRQLPFRTLIAVFCAARALRFRPIDALALQGSRACGRATCTSSRRYALHMRPRQW